MKEIQEYRNGGNKGIHEWRKYRNTGKKEIKKYMKGGNKGTN